MSNISEPILLEEGDVIITSRRAIIGTETYPLSDIISVRITKDSSTIGCLFAVMLSGAFFLGMLSFITTQYSSEIRLSAFIVGGAALIIALLVPPDYILQIRSMSGKFSTLRSINVDYLRRVADALEGAMTPGQSFGKGSLVKTR